MGSWTCRGDCVCGVPFYFRLRSRRFLKQIEGPLHRERQAAQALLRDQVSLARELWNTGWMPEEPGIKALWLRDCPVPSSGETGCKGRQDFPASCRGTGAVDQVWPVRGAGARRPRPGPATTRKVPCTLPSVFHTSTLRRPHAERAGPPEPPDVWGAVTRMRKYLPY